MTRSQAPLLVALLVALAFVGWFALATDEPEPAPEAPAPAVAEVPDEDPARSPAELALQAADEPESQRELAPAVADEQAAAVPAGVPVTPWPAEGLELRLVHARTGQPAAGARVHHLLSRDAPVEVFTWDLLRSGRGLRGGAVDGSKVYEADQAGRVRIPDERGESLVVAKLGDERAYRFFGGLLGGVVDGSAATELALDVPRSLVVAVQDDLGQPVSDRQVELDGLAGELLSGSTGTSSAGQVELFNANTLLAQLQEGHPLEVGVTLWDRTRVTAQVDLSALPEEPIVLVVPAGGEVHVQVVGPDGLPVSGSASIELLVEGPTASFTDQSWTSGGQPEVFRGLPPGARVVASLGEWSELKATGDAPGIVPPAGAEPLLLSIPVEPSAERLIRGRLVDVEGAPLGRRSFAYTTHVVAGGGTSSSSSSDRTDKDGTFELRLSTYMQDLVGDDMDLSLSFSLAPGDPDGSGELVSERLGFLGAVAWPLELGDVVCARAPQLAAGRVVDRAGQPVAGASVSLSVLPPDAQPPADFPLHFFLQRLEPQSSQPTDADGRFVVEGPLVSGRLFALAEAAGYGEGEQVELVAGAQDVELVLQAAGGLMGSIAVPEGQDPGAWSVGISPLDEARHAAFSPKSLSGGWSSDGTWWDSNLETRAGTFGWRDLAPGTYRIRVKLQGLGEPVRQWDDVVVAAGDVTRDPRLQDVEVGDLLTLVPLEVVDAAGQRLASARWSQLGSEGFQVTRNLPGGYGNISLAALPTQLQVSAPGYLGRLVTADGGPLRVTLERAPQVSLRLPAGLQVPQGVELAVMLHSSGDTAESPFGIPLAAPEPFVDGLATLHPSSLGLQGVEVLVSRRSGFSTSTHYLDWLGSDGGRLELGADADGQTFDLPVTQAMLEATLSGL